MRLTAAEWGASGRTLPQVGGQADETVEILCAAELPFRHEGVVRRISQSENRTPESSFDLFGKMVDRADDRLVICADRLFPDPALSVPGSVPQATAGESPRM